MEFLQKYQHIGDNFNKQTASQRLRTDFLFGDDRGKMFGVLECLDEQNKPVILKAFSGQYNGLWEVEGWAPPLFSTKAFFEVTREKEQQIMHLTNIIAKLPSSSQQRKDLISKRKRLSQNLMQQIHKLYKVHNFKGMSVSLHQAFNSRGIPTGAGDCCAPKLLNLAAKKGLKPNGMTEFFWGKTNKSQTRVHGQIYPSCHEKCQPLLGYMLCGSEKQR